MSRARVNGTSLYYEDMGAGAALLFVHGAVTDATSWAGQIERLSSSFRCIAYDRRGSSRSPIGRLPTVGIDAADAAALIVLLGVAPCVVVATSAGGRIALELMVRYPHLVVGAVLSEPAVFELDPGDHVAFDLSVRRAVEGPLSAGDPLAAVEAFARVIDPGEWASVPEAERDRRRANHAALLRLGGSTPTPITPGQLQQVRVPCVVVAGSETHEVFRRIAGVLASTIPGAQLVEVAGSGHQTYATRPDAFARIVRTLAGSVHGIGDAPRRGLEWSRP